jgi:hypothetical protein
LRLTKRLAVLGGSVKFANRFANTSKSAQVAIWALTERAGSVAVDSSGNARNGAYSGGTLAGTTINSSGVWTSDGTGGHVNLYSAGLNTNFPRAAGALVIWGKVNGSTAWGDTSTTRTLCEFYIDSNNKIIIVKETTQYSINIYLKSGGVDTSLYMQMGDLPDGAVDDTFCIGINWDSVAATTAIYLRGSLVKTLTGTAAFSGNLGNTATIAGRDSTSGTKYWNGAIGYIGLWNAPLTAAEHQYLAGHAPQTPAAYTAADEFTIIHACDIFQTPASYASWYWEESVATQWIVDNAAAQNVKAVVFTGDLVETAATTAQWAPAKAAIDLIDGTTTPYMIGIGNHDYTDASTRTRAQFDTDYPQSRYTGHGWWNGGFYESGHSDNAYFFITVNSIAYMIMTIEYNPRVAVQTWANDTLTANATKPTMIFTHALLDIDGTYYSGIVDIWNNILKLHDNIVFVECGHAIEGMAARRVDNSNGGKAINQMLFNSQKYTDYRSGVPYLRMITLRPTLNQIVVQTYSPEKHRVMTGDANSFTLSFTFPTVTPPAGHAGEAMGCLGLTYSA